MSRKPICILVAACSVALACSEQGGQNPTPAAGGSAANGSSDAAAGGASAASGNAGASGALSGSAGASGAAASAGAGTNLPDPWKSGLEPGVNWGLAKDFPNDVGIGTDPFVLGSEDFETGSVTIVTEEDRYKNNVTVTDTEHYTGKFAGVHTWPQGLNGVTTRFPLAASAHQDPRAAYFMRMCFKYDSSFHPGDPSVGVGVKGFGIYFENGTGNANTCAGMSWYDVSCQFVGWGPSQKPQANNGFLWVGHMYSYNRYPEQAIATLGDIKLSDPPDGTQSCRFSSYANPFEYIVFQTWRCYELGLYLNTPTINDGEARFWIDGVLQSRTTHMRFRDLEEQKPSSMHLNLYRTTEQFPQTMVRWADNIVLSRRYIGPVKLVP